MTQKKERRVFSNDFKKEVLAKAAQGEKISELAQKHSTSSNLAVSSLSFYNLPAYRRVFRRVCPGLVSENTLLGLRH